MDKQTKAGESMAEFADAMFIDPDGTEDEAATGPFRVGRGCEPMVELRFADVSRHSVVPGVWVAFFQECQRYDRRGQGGLSAPCSFSAVRAASTLARAYYAKDCKIGAPALSVLPSLVLPVCLA